MSTGVSLPTEDRALGRSDADRAMRRLLFLAPDAPKTSILGAQQAFGRSVVISGIRCLVTYVIIPIVGVVTGVAPAVGPVLGLIVGAVAMVALFFATRRFFAADHRYRWRYAAAAAAVLVLLLVQAGFDIATLVRS